MSFGGDIYRRFVQYPQYGYPRLPLHPGTLVVHGSQEHRGYEPFVSLRLPPVNASLGWTPDDHGGSSTPTRAHPGNPQWNDTSHLPPSSYSINDLQGYANNAPHPSYYDHWHSVPQPLQPALPVYDFNTSPPDPHDKMLAHKVYRLHCAWCETTLSNRGMKVSNLLRTQQFMNRTERMARI